MLSSRHKLRFAAPVREVRLKTGSETLISENKFREQFEERYRAGFEAGQKALGEQLIEQRKQLLDIQNGLFRSLQAALPGVVAECEQSLVLLALEAAKKVVRATAITPEIIEATVRSAVSELQGTTEYHVFLHPEDLAILQNIGSGILPGPESEKIKFSPDAGIARGDCVIQTRHGSIASVREELFDKMERAVLC